MLRDDAFAHDLIQEATLRTLPTALARHLHACVATWLQEHAGEPARLAAHWQAAGLPLQAVPWLERAADRAHAQWRPVEEAGLLNQLVGVVADDTPERAGGLLLRLAAVQVQATALKPPPRRWSARLTSRAAAPGACRREHAGRDAAQPPRARGQCTHGPAGVRPGPRTGRRTCRCQGRAALAPRFVHGGPGRSGRGRLAGATGLDGRRALGQRRVRVRPRLGARPPGPPARGPRLAPARTGHDPRRRPAL